MEETMLAQGSPRTFDGGAAKMFGVDRDELERIVAARLG
jgi:hypothetical protein